MLWVCKSSSKRFCNLRRRGLMDGRWIERKKAITKNCWAIWLEGSGRGRFWGDSESVIWSCIPPAGGQEVGWEEDGDVGRCCQGRQYSYASLSTGSPFLHLANCRSKYWGELWHIQECLHHYSLTTQHRSCLHSVCFALAVSGLQMVYSLLGHVQTPCDFLSGAWASMVGYLLGLLGDNLTAQIRDFGPVKTDFPVLKKKKNQRLG